jgi:hypothetical protein
MLYISTFLNKVLFLERSENEHNFEDDQVHIDEENSNNISECFNEDNNKINQ